MVYEVDPGESDLIEKKAAVGDHTSAYDLFMLSENSSYGRIVSLRGDAGETPLQQGLVVFAQYIINVGLAVGGIVFLIIFIRYFILLKNIKCGSKEKGEEFLNVLILSITVVAIAVPEGLPLAVTIALAFTTTRMPKDKNLVSGVPEAALIEPFLCRPPPPASTVITPPYFGGDAVPWHGAVR
ncbi:hypothetical protein BDV06DRAFT_221223 [Aspergillus oleicola]